MTDNRTTELLPCPFCGGEAVFHDCLRPPETYPCRVYCDNCWAEVGGYSTEAEAIAAWNTRADYHGYEQAAIEAWESIKAWNTRTHGTLTAEQVRDAIERHVKFYEGGDYDEQAIADELNARAERTCEAIKGKCSNCGKDLPEDPYSDYEGNFCPSCGARTRRMVGE